MLSYFMTLDVRKGASAKLRPQGRSHGSVFILGPFAFRWLHRGQIDMGTRVGKDLGHYKQGSNEHTTEEICIKICVSWYMYINIYIWLHVPLLM